MTRALLLGCAALAVLAGVQSWRLERVKTELHDAKQTVKAWESYRETAQASAEDAARQCSERVAEARRSAQRIASLVEKPYEVDPSGCPVRSLLPSDELRSAISPAPRPSP